jgi:hypothetical protein
MLDIVAFKNVISRRSLLKSAPLVAAIAVSLDCLRRDEAGLVGSRPTTTCFCAPSSGV